MFFQNRIKLQGQ